MTLTQYRQAIKAALDADAYIADSAAPTPKPITVLVENIGAIDATLEQQLAAMGISVLVTDPDFNNLTPDNPEADCEFDLILQVTEDVPQNQSTVGANKPSADVALRVASVLHNYQPGDFGRLRFIDAKIKQTKPQLVRWLSFKVDKMVPKP